MIIKKCLYCIHNLIEKRLFTFIMEFELSKVEGGWEEGRLRTDHTTQLLLPSVCLFAGYGHIAPKTQMGKVATILYAIVGIPMMLLCLSNIGDMMANSFRFLYWRVCCFACTRSSSKRRNSERRSRSVRSSHRSVPSVIVTYRFLPKHSHTLQF